MGTELKDQQVFHINLVARRTIYNNKKKKKIGSLKHDQFPNPKLAINVQIFNVQISRMRETALEVIELPTRLVPFREIYDDRMSL